MGAFAAFRDEVRALARANKAVPREELLRACDRVRDETKMSAYLADSPLTCVVLGSGRSLEEFDVMSYGGSGKRRRRARR